MQLDSYSVLLLIVDQSTQLIIFLTINRTTIQLSN